MENMRCHFLILNNIRGIIGNIQRVIERGRHNGIFLLYSQVGLSAVAVPKTTKA